MQSFIDADLPAPTGLYDPRFEHDGCGVSFVADMHGRRSRRIVQQRKGTCPVPQLHAGGGRPDNRQRGARLRSVFLGKRGEAIRGTGKLALRKRRLGAGKPFPLQRLRLQARVRISRHQIGEPGRGAIPLAHIEIPKRSVKDRLISALSPDRRPPPKKGGKDQDPKSQRAAEDPGRDLRAVSSSLSS